MCNSFAEAASLWDHSSLRHCYLRYIPNIKLELCFLLLALLLLLQLLHFCLLILFPLLLLHPWKAATHLPLRLYFRDRGRREWGWVKGASWPLTPQAVKGGFRIARASSNYPTCAFSQLARYQWRAAGVLTSVQTKGCQTHFYRLCFSCTVKPQRTFFKKIKFRPRVICHAGPVFLR